MDDCVFCSIVEGQAPSSIIYEDTESLGMLTLRPMNRGHSLVIPKYHVESLCDLTAQMGGHLFQVGMDVAEALRKSDVRCEGVNFWLADGVTAGQEVFHVHLHVLPRFETDTVQFDADRLDPSRDKMDSTAEEIRSGFGDNS